MPNVTIFKFEESTPIRTITKENEPWFVAKDVCDILGLTNPSVSLDMLDSDERSKFLLGRQGEANIINESRLYALVIRSNKPNARKFRKWITSEVLPSIRKTGKYAAPVQPELPLGDSLSALLRMKYNGVPVVPTPDLANAFGMEHWNLLQFFFRKRKEFIDNVDMFRIKGVTNTLMNTIRTSGSIVKTGCSSVTLWTESGIRKMQMLLDRSYMEHKQLVCSAPSVPEKKPEAVLPIPKRTGKEMIFYKFRIENFMSFEVLPKTKALLEKLYNAGFDVSYELGEVGFTEHGVHTLMNFYSDFDQSLQKMRDSMRTLKEKPFAASLTKRENSQFGGFYGFEKGH